MGANEIVRFSNLLHIQITLTHPLIVTPSQSYHSGSPRRKITHLSYARWMGPGFLTWSGVLFPSNVSCPKVPWARSWGSTCTFPLFISSCSWTQQRVRFVGDFWYWVSLMLATSCSPRLLQVYIHYKSAICIFLIMWLNIWCDSPGSSSSFLPAFSVCFAVP